MKDVLGSLPEVITAYKNYNLLVPTATDVQLNPFYKFHVEEVPVDLGENSGDIFKVGSVKTGKQDERGKDIWEDVYSLSKPLLNKMAMAAGIQFNPKETYGERIDRVTYRAQAQGAMRKADGTARTETDQKVICLEDEEDKYRMTSNGKLEIESKKEMKKRGLDSPDRADALALALYLGKIKKHTGTAPGVKELQELTKDNYWG